jgi:hypothetical protein
MSAHSSQLDTVPETVGEPAPPMVHIASTCCPPYDALGLCGARLRRLEVLPSSEPVECAVCADLEHKVPCPRGCEG